MGKVIYKYPLAITDRQTIKIPAGASILSVGNQRGTLCMWAAADPSNPLKDLEVEIHGTGNPIEGVPMEKQFIGTVITEPFVWHVFIN